MTGDDIAFLLGEVEPDAIARILRTGASSHELQEALRGCLKRRGPLPSADASPRVHAVQSILAELYFPSAA